LLTKAIFPLNLLDLIFVGAAAFGEESLPAIVSNEVGALNARQIESTAQLHFFFVTQIPAIFTFQENDGDIRFERLRPHSSLDCFKTRAAQAGLQKFRARLSSGGLERDQRVSAIMLRLTRLPEAAQHPAHPRRS
jgi:hypothetical protein